MKTSISVGGVLRRPTDFRRSFSLLFGVLFWAIAAVQALAQMEIKPAAAVVCTGQSITFTAVNVPGGQTVDWTVTPTADGGSLKDSGTSTTYTAPDTVVKGVVVSATAGDANAQANIALYDAPCASDSEARAIIGFEQAGASAASAEQHFFFDFFIDRRMKQDFLSLWGNVRVASYPQQIDTPVAQFAANFATTAGNLKVNQLAETAEFSTGLDWHPKALRWNPDTATERRLGFIFSVGAKGPFVPKSRLSLFQVPATTSPQYARFAAQFPSAAQSQYVGFIPPDRDRFYRSFGASIRLTTQYRGDSDASRAPATYTFLFGQDENVSGGTLTGAVAKFDVFYPLPIQKARFIYLFGNADLRLSKATNITPFVLDAAPSSITGAEPSVAIIATPSNRDVYRIGFGIDAVGLICTWVKC